LETTETKKLLAREAIRSAFGDGELDKESYTSKDSSLKQKGACFVTLTKNGNLRGCIGSLVAHKNLYEDIVSNARSAAFGDPRFLPLDEGEFGQIEIEVSILSEPKELEYSDVDDLKSKLRPEVDGVILISKNGRQATFLPQVWEQLPSFEHFFSHLCQKAGLSQGCLKDHPTIYTYQVEKIK